MVASVPYQLESATARIEAAKAQAQAAMNRHAMTEPAKPKPPRRSRLQALTLENEQLEAEELAQEVSPSGATAIAECPDRQQVVMAGTLRTVRLRPRAGVPVLEADLGTAPGR